MTAIVQRLVQRTVPALLALFAGAAVQAQDLPAPAKQMRLIVPYAAGGTSDILGRMLAQRLGERLGRQVIVDNRAGSGGSIGTDATVRSDPDGSTILLHSGAIATEPALKKNLPYDVQRDLAPVTTAVIGPFALVVNNELPVKTVPELLAYVKANPGKLNFGTPGIGTSVHLTSEYLKVSAGLYMVHIPYKGAALALNGLMGNEVQVVIDPLATAKKLAEAGKVRAIAVTTAQRTDLWPELPTLAEGGVKGFDAGVWYGLYVPAKTPKATVDRLNAEFVAILNSPEMKTWLRGQGLQPIADKPEESRKWLAAEIERWRGVVKSAGITPE
jgi:tripartite-type tricarboxylate transporter receptor subunit TctC